MCHQRLYAEILGKVFGWLYFIKEKRESMIKEIRFENELWVLDGWDVDKEGKTSKIYFKVKQVGT